MLPLMTEPVNLERLSRSRRLVLRPLPTFTPQAPKKKPAPKGLSQWELFAAFFKAGLAFGGGLGIMAALEKELVERKRVVSREDFLATYALARLVPAATNSAAAVAYGYRFGGWLGSAVALTALVLPSAALTVLLTMAYQLLEGTPVLPLLSTTVLPAALAFIVLAALKFGKEVFKPSPELVIAAAAFLATAVLNVHPSLVLLGGGLIGLIAWQRR